MDHPSSDTMWRYALATLPPRRRRAVREHALACDACRRELSRTVVARRALGGDPSRPTHDEMAAWETEILDRATGGRGRRQWWGGMALVLAAGAAALLMLPRAQDDQLTPRGVKSTAVAVRALCVDRDGAVRDPAWGPCPVGSYLKIMVDNIDSIRPRFTVVAVVQEELWHLYPASVDEPLLPWPSEMTALPGSYTLSAEKRGVLRVALLASEAERLGPEDPIWSWVRSAARGSHRDVLGRFDAVILELQVGGGP